MSTYIDHQKWRYATKTFDATKAITSEDIEILKDSIVLSSSSYGLQPYKVLIIENKDLKEKLKPASFNQSQITDASHVMVFLINGNINDKEVDIHISNIAETRNIPVENLDGYRQFMKSRVSTLPDDVKLNWTSKQAYIALANVMSAAAELKIDSCPIEGFDSEQYDKILELNDTTYSSTVVVALGYRSTEDDTQHMPKVRKTKEELFTHL